MNKAMRSAMALQVLLMGARSEDKYSAETCSSPGCSNEDMGAEGDSQVLLQAARHVEKHRIEQEAFFSINPAAFSETMTETMTVKIDGQLQEDGELHVYAGSEERGVQKRASKAPFDPTVPKYMITIYANGNGEKLTFKYEKAGEFIDLNVVGGGNGPTKCTIDQVTTFTTNSNCGNALPNGAVQLEAAAAPPTEAEAQPWGPADTDAPPAPAGPAWTVNAPDFEHSLTITASVTLAGQQLGEGELAAFIDGEVRGVQKTSSSPPFPPFLGQKAFYLLMVHFNNPDRCSKITFKFKSADGSVTDLDEVLFARIDGNYGKLQDPVTLTAATGECKDAAAQRSFSTNGNGQSDVLDEFIQCAEGWSTRGFQNACAVGKAHGYCEGSRPGQKLAQNGLCAKTCGACQ